MGKFYIPIDSKTGKKLPPTDCSAITTITGLAIFRGLYSHTNISEINLSNLTTVSGISTMQVCFSGCINLASVNLSSLTTIGGTWALHRCFENCTSLQAITFNSLANITDGQGMSECFRNCTALTSVGLSSLTTLTGFHALNNCFNGCTSLTSLSFPALTTSSFGSNTNQFNNMLNRVTGCTVHFPAAIQSTIGSWSDVVAGFGGTNTTVLFDL